MKLLRFLLFLHLIFSLLQQMQHDNDQCAGATRAEQREAGDIDELTGREEELQRPVIRLGVRVGDYNELRVGNNLSPSVLVFARARRRYSYGHVINKVGRLAQAEYCVGQLEGKVSRLAELRG